MEGGGHKKRSILKRLEGYFFKRRTTVMPAGCFSVYVGPERQRFMVRTEYANHPLFRMLLEDAESEYGFTSDGPLQLPCEVDLFCRVLAAMDESDCDGDDDQFGFHQRGGGSCSPFSPAVRRLGRSGNSYDRLVQPRFQQERMTMKLEHHCR